MNPEIIAFYLPQYHPTPHNDEWWGKGFTEWTNVGKAKPLFLGHYQPKVPADLGYYDLRLPAVREQQAELAREAGVTGFCYYHYWFEDGKEELDLPFKEVLRLREPSFPFCLCWANESWHKKFWNPDGTADKQLLAEQKYQGEKENTIHFYSLLDAFMDTRYMKLDNKPIFMIYSPTSFENISNFIKLWNKLAKDNGFNGIHFIAYSLKVDSEYHILKNLGFDSVCSCRIGECPGTPSLFKRLFTSLRSRLGIPRVYNYKKVVPTLIGDIEKTEEDVYPTLVPNWDHTPRSGKGGYLYSNSTPELFQMHAEQVLSSVRDKNNNNICFLKSWNEWGEGNYMEPDLKYGRGYIYALRHAIDKVYGISIDSHTSIR